MASIGEVFGQNFQSQAVMGKAVYAAKLYASNIVHKQFSFRNESQDMWNGDNMKPELISTLKAQVLANNQMFRLTHVPKTSADINRFPYLINGPVEYFNVIDLSTKGKTLLYSIYITPTQMEAY